MLVRTGCWACRKEQWTASYLAPVFACAHLQDAPVGIEVPFSYEKYDECRVFNKLGQVFHVLEASPGVRQIRVDEDTDPGHERLQLVLDDLDLHRRPKHGGG